MRNMQIEITVGFFHMQTFYMTKNNINIVNTSFKVIHTKHLMAKSNSNRT